MHKNRIPSLLTLILAVAMAAFPGQGKAAGFQGNEYLEMDITPLMNIVVTSASKHAQSLSDLSYANFVINQEGIRRSGVTCIPDAPVMRPESR